ncbi:MAG: VTT domain-containing protein [Acidobacteriaceae bacterium]|jgi:membrane protein DedA with SNARE-associated domain/rhodanese-related sulfurtransferase|nr:VTT domain-containing protein [Acidobacteriaceae bacterium]
MIPQHPGYYLVGLLLFCTAVGLPLPASIGLLLAGAAVAHHIMNPAAVALTAIGAAFLGDTVLFFAGRYSGWWLLATICRLSANPETCFFRSADYFYRRGARVLLFAKFLPGLGSLAAPLAGSLKMRYSRFARLDLFNATAYCMVWLTAGVLLHRFVTQIEVAVVTAGHLLAIVIGLLLAIYAGFIIAASVSARRYRLLERVSVEDVARRMEECDLDRLVIIADVRSHGYYDPGMQRIKNSIRLEPNRLTIEFAALREFMQPECEIFVYCSCARESTSARVAHQLAQQDCKVKIIQGGLRAWVKGGYPVEPVPPGDVEHLPCFD